MTKTYAAGEQGFLLIDLVAAIMILALTGVTLLSAGRQAKLSLIAAEKRYEAAAEKYEEALFQHEKK